MEIEAYHKTRKSLDFNFITRIFDEDRRKVLAMAQKMNPNSIIWTTDGAAGSVPTETDGTIIYIPGI